MVLRLCWYSLKGFIEEVIGIGWEDLSRWRGGVWVSMLGREIEGVRRKGI